MTVCEYCSELRKTFDDDDEGRAGGDPDQHYASCPTLKGNVPSLDFEVLEFRDGYAVRGEFPHPQIVEFIREKAGPLPLVIADPPYGHIVPTNWDERITWDDHEFSKWMISWTKEISGLSLPGAALYVWGGIGRAQNFERNKPPFRPFFRYLTEVETETSYSMATLITWKKKRGYGIQWSYLFTREECAYLVLGNPKTPRRFEVPLLDEKRGYAGYDLNHPAKSEYLRRTNVWDDVTEILSGKEHINEKPVRLMEIQILAHTERGEWVLDPFAGSGTTAEAARTHGRRFIVVERDPEEFRKMVERIRTVNPSLW